MKFRKYLENKDWFNFQKDRGSIPIGNVQKTNSISKPAHQDKDLDQGNYSDKLELMQLYDRILDSPADSLKKDIALFIRKFTKGIELLANKKLDELNGNTLDQIYNTQKWLNYMMGDYQKNFKPIYMKNNAMKTLDKLIEELNKNDLFAEKPIDLIEYLELGKKLLTQLIEHDV